MNQRKFFILSVLMFLFTSCIKRYNNQKVYECAIGQVVDIYYSTNSCCFYCVGNESSLKHVKFLDKVIIDPSSKDCDGCSFTGAFKFKALNTGTDTIYLKYHHGGQSCGDSASSQEIYVVEVK